MTHSPRKKERPVEVPPRPQWAKHLFYAALGAVKAVTRLEYRGLDNLPAEPPYILAANHQSYLDGLWVFGGLSRDHFDHATAFAGADLSSDHGTLGKLLMAVARPIPVDRRGNPIRGLIRAKRALAQDNIVLIHPEGTRTHRGYVSKLQSGAGYLAVKTGAPIIPVYIGGAYDFFSRHDKRPRLKTKRTGKRPKLTVTYYPPLDPEACNDPHCMTDELTRVLLKAEEDWLQGPYGRNASVVPESEDWTRKPKPEPVFTAKDKDKPKDTENENE